MSKETMSAKVKELRELRRMREELTGMIEALQDEIKAIMTAQETETLTGADWKITWKPVTSSRLDSIALKRELPEIASRFPPVRAGMRKAVTHASR